MKIWANTIVHNEENFIWFALMSVIDYVDKILVWDSGSTDQTIEIIKTIKSKKIEFKQVGKLDKFEFSRMRQQMLDQSDCDWILILDGDEVWWQESIKKVIDTVDKKGYQLEAVAVPFYNALGDVYHYQSEDAGKYQLLGKKGHLTIKAINTKISGLHVTGPYGMEGYVEKDNLPIQNKDSKKIAFVPAPFLHLTHLRRSAKDGHHKYKHELGLKFAENFKLPEVFYQKYPAIVPSPLLKASKLDQLISTSVSPLRQLKRKLL